MRIVLRYLQLMRGLFVVETSAVARIYLCYWRKMLSPVAQAFMIFIASCECSMCCSSSVLAEVSTFVHSLVGSRSSQLGLVNVFIIDGIRVSLFLKHLVYFPFKGCHMKFTMEFFVISRTECWNLGCNEGI